MKSASILFLNLMISITLSAQLKVDNFGRVGMGTLYPNPFNQVHIIKNVLVSNPIGTRFQELVIETDGLYAASQQFGHPKVGSSTGRLNIYNNNLAQFNRVFASGFLTVSDLKTKYNIIEIENATEKLMRLKPIYYSTSYNYQVGVDSIENVEHKKYGFVSQEIEKALPEVDITENNKGFLMMDYIQIIPLLVQTVKEQQDIINEMNEMMAEIQSNMTKAVNVDSLEVSNVLHQNYPNPFMADTKIKFNLISTNFQNAKILIFDLQGVLVKSIDIKSHTMTEIDVSSNDLRAGRYLYSLLVNNIEIDTKTMIVLVK